MSNIELASANIFERFQASYKNQLDKIFLALPQGQNYRFGDINDLSGRIAAQLMALDVLPGDRVLAQTDKTPVTLALYLATLRIGAIFVPLHTAYTNSEVAYFIDDAQPKVFFCNAHQYNDLKRIAEQKGVTNTCILGNTEKEHFWKKAYECAPYTDVIPREPSDIAAFLYTSGTTGHPKAAMLSHDNLSSNALTLHNLWQFQPNDVLLHALPIFHVHGLFVALHCALLNASTVIYLPKYQPQAVRKALKHATVMMGVPTYYKRLLDIPEFNQDDCKNLRLFISGSAPMTEQLHQEWTKRTDTQILERYGMTEAGMISSNPYQGERIAGTVGYALPQVQVRIADEKGNELARGQVGVIETKGPNLFQGYWNMPEKTAQEFRSDGFFITGDLGRMAEDGRISILGREKDLIISGGYNIYPKEIEKILDQHPDIEESAVIGVPQSDLGECVIAIIVTKSKKHLETQSIEPLISSKLAKFKQPKKYFYIDELPKNAMGKVQKNILRQSYINTFQ